MLKVLLKVLQKLLCYICLPEKAKNHWGGGVPEGEVNTAPDPCGLASRVRSPAKICLFLQIAI